MALVSALTAMSGYSTGDLEFTVATLPGWAMTGLIEPESGWLLCNGATIPSTGRYAGLFALLNGAFGGAGVLPYLIDGWQPAAKGASILPTRGVTTGRSTVTLAVTHLPGHTHTFTDSGSNTGVSTSNGMGDMSANDYSDRVQGATFTGGGGAHNNMPPYIVVEGMLVKL